MSFWIFATALRVVDHAALANRGGDMKVRGQDNNICNSSGPDKASIGHTNGAGRVQACSTESTRKIKAADVDHITDRPVKRQNGTRKAPPGEPH
jgi:hypothetical protein